MKTLEFENYFMEPLRSMEKRATIRKSDKGLKEGDLVKCTFEWTDDYLIRRVRSVERLNLKIWIMLMLGLKVISMLIC